MYTPYVSSEKRERKEGDRGRDELQEKREREGKGRNDYRKLPTHKNPLCQKIEDLIKDKDKTYFNFWKYSFDVGNA